MENLNPEQLQEKLDRGDSVLLKLWKNGCGACKLSIPALERLEEKYKDQLCFSQISTDDYPEMLEIADTEILPIFFLFKKDSKPGKHIGFKGLKKMTEWIESELKS